MALAIAPLPLWLGIAYAQFTVYDTPEAGWALLAGAGAMSTTPLIGRWTRSIPRALHWAGFVITFALGAVSWFRGGYLAIVMQYLLLFPLCLYLFRRRRMALFWLPVIAAVSVGLHAAEVAGLTPPRVEGTTTAWFLNTVAMLVVVSGVGYVAIRDLDRREADIQGLAQRLAHGRQLESLGRLAGSVAHEFNNLLGAISARVESIRMDLAGADLATDDAEAIAESVRRGAYVTRRMLTFSREESVGTAIVDVTDLMQEVFELAQVLMPAGIVCRLEAADVPAYTQSDRGLLAQTLMSLCLNARDEMPRGGTLTLSLREVDYDDVLPAPRYGELRSGRYVVASVADTGRPSAHSQEWPFPNDGAAGEDSELAFSELAGSVVDAGGGVDVVRVDGGGMAVHIYLLAAAAPSAAHAEERAVVSPEGWSVLLVEDDFGVRRAIERLLSRRGIQVQATFSAEAALALAARRDRPFDALVTDIVMPGASGPQLAEAIRERWPSIRVVFISGYADRDLPIQPDQVEGAVFLRKPVTTDALLDAMGVESAAMPASDTPDNGR